MHRTLEAHESRFGSIDVSNEKSTQKKVTIDLRKYMLGLSIQSAISPRILKLHPEASRSDIDL
eukprot:5252788-Pyramimonas_sp.AAC.1